MKISFSENQFVNLMFIPVVCNDVNGIAMFDTGAEITVVKKSFFEKIGIKIKEEKCIMGNNNNGRVEATKGVIPYIKIGEMQENNVDIVIVEDSAFDFDKDDDGNSFPADMLLGRNVIKNYYWRINMPERYFEIMPSGTAPKGDIYNWNGFLMFEAVYKGDNILMGFDSGHTETFLGHTWKNRVDKTKKIISQTVGIGSLVEEQVDILEEFKIRIGNKDICLHNIEISNGIIPGSRGGMEGLFGIDIVENSIWHLDFERKYFEIE